MYKILICKLEFKILLFIKMETQLREFPPHVIQNIAIKLPLGDVFKMCLGSRRLNELVCGNDMFWKNKLAYDYEYTLPFESSGKGRSDYLRLVNYFFPRGRSSTLLSGKADLIINCQYMYVGGPIRTPTITQCNIYANLSLAPVIRAELDAFNINYEYLEGDEASFSFYDTVDVSTMLAIIGRLQSLYYRTYQIDMVKQSFM